MKKIIKLLSISIALLACVTAQAQSVGWLEVERTATSEGAELYVDGKYVTDVPAKITLSVGKHEVIFKSPLYLDYKASVNITKNLTSTLSIEMQKNYNYVTISVFMGFGNYGKPKTVFFAVSSPRSIQKAAVFTASPPPHPTTALA